ncbi:MAG: enoyl-CoA hydratase/isomerase family protein [Chloroflexi bacterium]|nr:enoyl-CoA hydratase/isomerase family protein [Chloroflexota bacterium]
MSYQYILYDKRSDGIAYLTLNRPEKLNALSRPLQDEVADAVRAADRDPEVRVLVLRGAGRAFSAGYDLSPQPAPAGQYIRRDTLADRAGLEHTVDCWMTIWNARKPVLGQVHGYCLAGGTDLVLMCDAVIAADDAQIGHPGVRALGMPLTSMWPYLVGPQRAKLWLLTGGSMDGVEAERIGLVARAVPAERLEQEVLSIAQTMAKVLPELLIVNKAAINRVYELMGLRTAQQNAVELDAICHATESVQEFGRVVREKGLKAALEWRDTKFGDYRGAKV